MIVAELKKRTTEVLASGIIIETSLNPVKQQQDDQAISSLLHPKDLQAGAVVIDNTTREIVSIYGGKNYKKADFHRAFQAVRQPGSAIKPLLVYAPLFESTTYTTSTPVNSGALCIGTYCPNNVGGYVYGNTSIKEAFRHSHNTAAVRLLQVVGIEEAFSFLKPFNFRTISDRDMNYGAALGGFSKGFTPLELATRIYVIYRRNVYARSCHSCNQRPEWGNSLSMGKSENRGLVAYYGSNYTKVNGRCSLEWNRPWCPLYNLIHRTKDRNDRSI